MTRRRARCRVVDVDGQQAIVRGVGEPTAADLAAVAEFARALRGGKAALLEYDRKVRAEAAAREAEQP